MEYQKIINLLENTPNQTTKFRKKKKKGLKCGTYHTNSQNKSKTSM